jgi:MoxR-like ATPase
MHAAQSFAAISGRDFVTPDDVRYLAPYVFNHRIIMNARDGGFDMAVSILNELMKTVSVPVEDWTRS